MSQKDVANSLGAGLTQRIKSSGFHEVVTEKVTELSHKQLPQIPWELILLR